MRTEPHAQDPRVERAGGDPVPGPPGMLAPEGGMAEPAGPLSLLRSVLDSTLDGILVVDVAGHVVTYNRQFAGMLDIPEEILATGDTDRAVRFLLDELADPGRLLAAAERVRANPQAESHHVLDFKDGRVFESHSRPHFVEGRVAGWVVSVRDVTERRRTEEALREIEEKYRSLVETIPAIVYVDAADEVMTTLYISPQVESVLGYSADEWKADPELCNKILHPMDRERVLEETKRVAAGEGSWRAEYRMIARDGRTVWLHDVATLVRDDSGRPAFWQGVLLDITERRQAEESLKAAEQKHRALVEGLPAIVYLAEFGESGRWRYVSPRIEEMLGFTAEEWMADPDLWYERIHPDDREFAAETEARSRASGDPLGVEYRMVARDGRVVWVRDEAIVVPDRDGRPWFLQGFMYDVTERKRAEEELRRQKEELAALHETALGLIDRLDPQGLLEAIVVRATALVGSDVGYLYTVEPETGDLVARLGTELFGEYVGSRLRRGEGLAGLVWESGEPLILDDYSTWSKRHPLFQGLPLRAVAALPLRAGGDVVGVIGVGRFEDGRPFTSDETELLARFAQLASLALENARLFQAAQQELTERKQAEEALRQAYERERDAVERLRTVDEMKNAFMAAVSHELRTPLSSVLGFAMTLEREQINLGTGERREILSRLAFNARKLDRLLSDLLDLDRLNRGIVEPRCRPTDVAALLRQAVDESDILEGRPVEVDAEPTVLNIDGPKVERIVENLLANAAKYTPPGTPVWVRARPQEGGVLIEVEDAGPGVSDALKTKIFEPFLHGESGAVAHASGTGIGLSLVARFAELHGGRAWVEDRPGGGARFCVYLPGAAA